MAYVWDPHKARRNLRKHGVDFADAIGALEDSRGRSREDPHPREERFVTLGLDLLGRIVVVSWLWEDNDIGLISARRATRTERRQYLAGDYDA